MYVHIRGSIPWSQRLGVVVVYSLAQSPRPCCYPFGSGRRRDADLHWPGRGRGSHIASPAHVADFSNVLLTAELVRPCSVHMCMGPHACEPVFRIAVGWHLSQVLWATLGSQVTHRHSDCGRLNTRLPGPGRLEVGVFPSVSAGFGVFRFQSGTIILPGLPPAGVRLGSSHEWGRVPGSHPQMI